MLFLHACLGTSQIIPLILADFNCKNYTKCWENTPVVVSGAYETAMLKYITVLNITCIQLKSSVPVCLQVLHT